MGRADTRFGYSQARMQARHGSRPSAADWSHVAATADLGALLQVLRGSPVGRWTGRLGNRPGVHDIERRLREEWLRSVDEVAAWQPESWREAVRWLRWIVYLPALQKLARGGRPPAWTRDDAVLGPIVARDPRERAEALRRTPLGPLSAGFTASPDTAGAWIRHWRQLWPPRGAARRPLESMVGEVGRLQSQLAALPATARADEVLGAFERRLNLVFRRNPLSPSAAVAHLGLLALDLRRIRGALATRALREGVSTP